MQCVVGSSIGARRTMEDAHLATELTVEIAGNSYPIQLFGVFDGHSKTEEGNG